MTTKPTAIEKIKGMLKMYVHNFNNLEEMDQFFKNHKLPDSSKIQ